MALFFQFQSIVQIKTLLFVPFFIFWGLWTVLFGIWYSIVVLCLWSLTLSTRFSSLLHHLHLLNFWLEKILSKVLAKCKESRVSCLMAVFALGRYTLMTLSILVSGNAMLIVRLFSVGMMPMIGNRNKLD